MEIRVLGPFWLFRFLIMHARRPIRPHTAIKPKIEVSAGGQAYIRLSL
jgi:hypothetical protein